MTREGCKNSGTVAVGVVLLLIVALGVLSVVRYFWVESVNEHYDILISAYIQETEEYKVDDQNRLRGQLLEEGIFMKMHKWDKKDFIKDEILYDEIVRAYNRQQSRKEQTGEGIIDTLIDL